MKTRSDPRSKNTHEGHQNEKSKQWKKQECIGKNQEQALKKKLALAHHGIIIGKGEALSNTKSLAIDKNIANDQSNFPPIANTKQVENPQHWQNKTGSELAYSQTQSNGTNLTSPQNTSGDLENLINVGQPPTWQTEELEIQTSAITHRHYTALEKLQALANNHRSGKYYPSPCQ